MDKHNLSRNLTLVLQYSEWNFISDLFSTSKTLYVYDTTIDNDHTKHNYEKKKKSILPLRKNLIKFKIEICSTEV